MKQIFFNSNGVGLFGALYRPDLNSKSAGVIICHPFAEEKKSAQKTLVDLAKALLTAGYHVLLFDFQGCGDSQGSLINSTLEDWKTNIHDAVTLLKNNAACSEVIVIGLRMSALLCFIAAHERHDVQKLVLVEPVSSFVTGFKEAVKQKMINELLTSGKAKGSSESLLKDLNNGKSLDLDGHEIGTPFFHSCMQMDDRLTVTNGMVQYVHAVSISPSGSPTRSFLTFCQRCFIDKDSCTFLALETFWNKIDGIDCSLFINKIVDICNHDRV